MEKNIEVTCRTAAKTRISFSSGTKSSTIVDSRWDSDGNTLGFLPAAFTIAINTRI